jgi:hypothetical protein
MVWRRVAELHGFPRRQRIASTDRLQSAGDSANAPHLLQPSACGAESRTRCYERITNHPPHDLSWQRIHGISPVPGVGFVSQLLPCCCIREQPPLALRAQADHLSSTRLLDLSADSAGLVASHVHDATASAALACFWQPPIELLPRTSQGVCVPRNQLIPRAKKRTDNWVI